MQVKTYIIKYHTADSSIYSLIQHQYQINNVSMKAETEVVDGNLNANDRLSAEKSLDIPQSYLTFIR